MFAQAEFDVRDWKYARPLKAPTPAPAADYETLVLDAAALGAASPSLADLRLVDDGNDEVPYRLSVERGRRESTRMVALVLNLSHQGPVTSFVLDLRTKPRDLLFQHNAVTVLVNSRDFRADVTVEASDDGVRWETIRERAVIFDVSSDYRVSHLGVSYPESTRHFVKVTVVPEKGGPLDVRGGTVSREVKSPASESEWTPAGAARKEEGRTTVWDVDLGYDNVPVSRVAIETDDVNFQRPVRVTAPFKGADGVERNVVFWSGSAWRFALPRASSEGLSVEGGEVRQRRFRVEIDNGDNPPLNVRAVRLFGPRHVLAFPAGRPHPYKLYSGNADAEAPVYDLAAFGGYLDLSRASAAAFAEAAPRPNPEYRPTDRRPWSEQHHGVFQASLVLLCAFLVALIVRKTREMLA